MRLTNYEMAINTLRRVHKGESWSEQLSDILACNQWRSLRTGRSMHYSFLLLLAETAEIVEKIFNYSDS